MSDVQENQAGEQGNVGTLSMPPSQDNPTNAPVPASLTPENATTTTPSPATGTSSITGSDASTPSNGSEPGNDASGASTATDASGTSAPAPDAVGNGAGSSDGAGSTAQGTSATGTDSSSSQSSTTNVIQQGTLVNGSVVNTAVPAVNPAPVAPVIAPSSMPSTQGYVPPGPGTAVNPAQAAPAVSFVQTGINEVDQIVERLMKDASIEAKIAINAIKEYVVKMKPGKMIATKDGIQSQVSLYQSFLTVINNIEGNDFRPAMQSILALLHAHKDGAFKETHVFRFVEHVPLSADHRKGFQKITTMLKTLANPATRQDLVRQINFDPVLKYGITERGRTKLASFFGK